MKYFLISAPVDWTPDQYIRRFLLPTGEYVSCVLWYVVDVVRPKLRVLTCRLQEQPLSHLRHRYCTMPFFQIPSLRPTREELEEIRGGYLLRSAKPEVWHRRVPRRAQEWIPGFPIQEQLH